MLNHRFTPAILLFALAFLFIPPADGLFAIPPTPAWQVINTNDTINTPVNVNASNYNGILELKSDSSILFNSIDGNTTATAGSTSDCGASGWYSDSSWTRCIPLSVNATLVASNQTAFPVLINKTLASLIGDVQADGDDILFTDSSNTKLPHELVSINSTSGYVEAWVNATSISNATNTEIKMYYGNSGASSQEDPNNVWSEAVAVYHLGSADGTVTSTVEDSAVHYGNVRNYTTNWLEFTSSTNNIDFTDDTDFEFGSNDFTIGAWVQIDDFIDENTIMSKWNTGQGEWLLNTVKTSGLLQLFTSPDGSGFPSVSSTTAIPLGVPVHVVVVKSGTSATFYVNGLAVSDNGGVLDATLHTGTANMLVGYRDDNKNDFDGKIGKVFVNNGHAYSASEVLDAYQTGTLVSTNLVLDAQLDEGTGTTANDDSGNSNTGTISGATWVTGQPSAELVSNDGYTMGTRAYRDFDGVNDQIVVSDDSSIQDVWSGGATVGATAIFRSDGEASQGFIIEKDNGSGWLIYLNGESNGFVKLQFNKHFSGTDGNWITTDHIVPLNVPVNFKIKYDDSSTVNTPTFYINGDSYTVGAGLTAVNSPTGTSDSDVGADLGIGNPATATTRTTDGGLSDIIIDADSEWSDATALQDYQTHDLDYTSYTTYYPLDEISGTESRNIGSGTAGSGTVSGATVVEGALSYGEVPVWDSGLSSHPDFDGTDDSINVGNVSDWNMGSSDFTIMGWMEFDDHGDFGYLFSRYTQTAGDREYGFSTNTSGELRFFTSSDGSALKLRTIDGTIPTGIPLHLAVTKSGTDATFYINGVLQTDDGTALDATLYTGAGDSYIGTFDGAPSSGFHDGEILNVAVYKGTALSQAQIQTHYDTGEVPTTTNLVGHWRMNEGTGTTITDESPAGNDGTLSGATWTDGYVSYADRFDSGGIELEGTSSHVRVPNFEHFTGQTPLTVFSVFTPTDNPTPSNVCGLTEFSGTSDVNSRYGISWHCGLDKSYNLYVGGSDDGKYRLASNADITYDVEQSIALSYDGSSTLDAYSDGVSKTVGSETAASDATAVKLFYIGRGVFADANTSNIDANISELIIFNTAKDADFMSTMHYNALDDTFVIEGAEVEYSVTPGGDVTTNDSILLYINTPQNSILGGIYNFTCTATSEIVRGVNSTGYARCEAVPVPTASTLGGILAQTCTGGEYMTGINGTDGSIICAP